MPNLPLSLGVPEAARLKDCDAGSGGVLRALLYGKTDIAVCICVAVGYGRGFLVHSSRILGLDREERRDGRRKDFVDMSMNDRRACLDTANAIFSDLI